MTPIAANYVPAVTPSLECARSLKTAIAQTAAMASICLGAGVTPAEAVQVGVGDRPWDEGKFSVEQLSQLGCRLFIGPSEESWIATEDSPDNPPASEGYGYELFLRRQVSAAEFAEIGEAQLFEWFWSHCAALPGQARIAAAPCLLLKKFNGVQTPAFNTTAERKGQGIVLHTKYSVTVGDELL